MIGRPTMTASPIEAAAAPEMEPAARSCAKPRGVLALVVAVAFMAAACAGGAGLDVAIGPVDHSCPVVNSCQHGR
jgi:hypothetical protein